MPAIFLQFCSPHEPLQHRFSMYCLPARTAWHFHQTISMSRTICNITTGLSHLWSWFAPNFQDLVLNYQTTKGLQISQFFSGSEVFLKFSCKPFWPKTSIYCERFFCKFKVEVPRSETLLFFNSLWSCYSQISRPVSSKKNRQWPIVFICHFLPGITQSYRALS